MKGLAEIQQDNQTNELKLGLGVTLDIAALIEGRLLVLANSGGGKSYAIRKICEVAYGHAQIIVLDVEGEFHTLRERFDFVLFGHEGGDYPISIESAGMLARRLLELGVSAVIDIYDLGARRGDFIAAFLHALLALPRALWHDTIIVVDEANKFCPEGMSRDENDAQHAIINLMTLGRKRGYAAILATQRIADLNKSAVAECNSAMIGRCVVDVDIKRAAKTLGVKLSEATEWLPALPRGDFYMFGDALKTDTEMRVALRHVGQVQTTHPKRGQSVPVTPPRATVKKALAGLANVIVEAQAEAKTAEDLRAKIVELERRLEGHPIVDQTIANSLKADKRAADLEEHLAKMTRVADLEGKRRFVAEENVRILKEAHRALHQRVNAATSAMADVQRHLDLSTEEVALLEPTEDARRDIVTAPGRVPAAAHDAVPVAGRSPSKQGAEQKLLDTLALIDIVDMPKTREAVAAWYGVHPNNKGFANTLGALRSRGLVAGLQLTEAGRHEARWSPHAPSSNEIHQRLLAPLETKQRQIMETSLGYTAYGATREALAERCGVHPNNKGFANNVGALRTRGFLTSGWPIRPTAIFDCARK